MSQREKKKSFSSFFRFSLRGILLVTLVVATALAWWSQTARKQRRVCDILSEVPHDAQIVTWEFEEPPSWLNWLPQSVLKLYDGHLFQRVARVEITAEFEDRLRLPRSLQNQLPELPYLEEIDFRLVRLDNTDLAWLEKVASLKRIGFDQCDWLDKRPLKLPSQIRKLTFENCDDVASLVASVGSHACIEEVSIDYCLIQADVLQSISGCRSLRSLTIHHYGAISFPADGFEQLRDLPSLENLRIELPRNSLTTDSIVAFSKFRNLRSLTFPTKGLDNTALRHLSSLSNLAQICFSNDPDSTEFFDSISSLPHLKIVETGWLSQTSLRSLVAALKSVPTLEWIEHPDSELPLAGLIELAKSPYFRGVQEYSEPAASGFTKETLTRLGGKAALEPMASTLHLDSAFDASGQWKHTSLLSGLKQLSLENSDITNDDLQDIVRIETLNRLDLNYTDVTNDGLMQLAACKNLQELSVLGFPLSPTIIESLPNLTRIQVGECELDAETLIAIAQLPNINRVDIEGALISEEVALAFSQCKSLKKLKLDRCYASTKTLSLLNSPTFAAVLATYLLSEIPSPDSAPTPSEPIVSAPIPATDLESIEPTPDEENWEDIAWDANYDGAHDFQRTTIRDEHFQLNWLSQVRRLLIYRQPVTDKAVDVICQANRIQELNIAQTQISNRGLARLLKLPDLDSLSIGGPQVNSESIDLIVQMRSNLRSLGVERTSLSQKDIEKLNSLERLDELWIKDVGLSAEQVIEELNLPQLKSLTIDKNRFEPSDLTAIRFNRVDSSALELSLYPHIWTSERLELLRGHQAVARIAASVDLDLDKLFEVASTMPNLRTLWFFDDLDPIELPGELTTLPQLTDLSLPEIIFTPQSLEWLSQHESLETLSVEGSRFPGQDLSALNQLVRLERLNLDNCGLQDQAIATLKAEQLSWLDLRNNKLTDASIPSLVTLGHTLDARLGGNALTPLGSLRFDLARNKNLAKQLRRK